jgi:hypothetical protein
MKNEPSKQLFVDQSLDSYNSFFDHDWAKAFMKEAENWAVEDLALNLGASWKGAANAARLPWLVVETLTAFADGLLNDNQPSAARILDACATRLGQMVQPPLSAGQRQSLDQAILFINGEILEAKRLNPIRYDRQAGWREMLAHPEFLMAVWSSQRIALADVFFAYEDFVLSCFRRVTNQPRYRIGRAFLVDLSKAYGPQLANDAWDNHGVKVAKLVRHAIAHNGGKETPDLAELRHRIRVIDGGLQVTPADTRAVFDDLKTRAMEILCETAARLPNPASVR